MFIDSRSIQLSLTDVSAFPSQMYQYLYFLTWTGPKPASSHSSAAQTVQYSCGHCYITTIRPGFFHLISNALKKLKLTALLSRFLWYCVKTVPKFDFCWCKTASRFDQKCVIPNSQTLIEALFLLACFRCKKTKIHNRNHKFSVSFSNFQSWTRNNLSIVSFYAIPFNILFKIEQFREIFREFLLFSNSLQF